MTDQPGRAGVEQTQHFWASVIYPLATADARALGDEWQRGAYAGSTGAPHVTGDDRTRFYANPGPARRLLDPAKRRHRSWPGGLPVSGLVVDAAEVVQVDRGKAPPAGYAIVHLHAAGAEIEAFSSLADAVRPRREAARKLLVAGLGDELAGHVPDVPRATSLVLSGWPGEETRGLLRWPGSSALDRRMTTMVTLPDDGRELPTAFSVPSGRPTPSYVVGWSAPSVGVVRVRPVRASNVDELRTLWLDAVLIEVRQRDAASSYAGRVTDLAQQDRDKPGSWTRLESEFRAWRARSAWQATTDHAMEQALARGLRAASGTDALVARVERELRDHAEVETRRGNDRLTIAVLSLTIASLVLPLLLHLAGAGGVETRDTYWVAAAAVAALVVTVAAVVAVRTRRGS
jgi:hypothetical protein